MLNRFSGLALAGVFYAVVFAVPVPSLQRYFLGHPIAVATTVLFWMAVAQLGSRYARMQRGHRQMDAVSDRDLLPESLHALAGLDTLPATEASAARPLLERLDAWRNHLAELPASVAATPLANRLAGLLDAQRRRGHARQLSEDMREAADRAADGDHDALQLVRIIVWAIPMLGFLGTVIGITETLGGLDFTDGTAAVDRLKAGLYVAFDTTALGIVLSVIAIFLQFPIEKSSRRLLERIDARAGELLPAVLAEAEEAAAEDPFRAIAQMSVEIRRAVESSVQLQAELWRRTIDEAHGHWHQAAAEAGTQLREALHETLGDSLGETLRQHTASLRQANREGADAIDHRWQQWQTALSDNARILLSHQKALLSQSELLAESHSRAHELERLQGTLDQNVRTLDVSVETLDRTLQGVAGAAGMADAMRILARAVDILAARLPAAVASESEGRVAARRKAA
ncbi:MotA/TolQ/ExbB proton channel family protein [Candidatus Laterigemmans baculatus]|uniref:MotA/TolQ/ExbB proton channel family protein n=1 Tax=Candidatus Laterigemmans baculatus TaxID=2770505 RepID=UPI0013D94DAD|nr:MotA/TolQ/ExbB proton channel family protein [Candidatus Laterigemmans baculatus]